MGSISRIAMAKRFIDTSLFDDEWFSELTTDAKLFWIYYLTKCDHAGLLKFNKKLIEFQIGIKSIDKCIDLIGNRLVKVNETLLFCPKFIQFQYPGFPKSKVAQQESAVRLLVNAGIWDELTNSFKDLYNSSIRLNEVFNKTYDSVSDNVSVSVETKKSENLIFTHKSQEFKNTWEKWVEYRKQIKKPYKSDISKQAALDKLGKSSEKDAIAMMLNSMAAQWQGLFEVQNNVKRGDGRDSTGFVQ